MSQKHDFYQGYEGEPEYLFRVELEPSQWVRAWGGHMDAIMNAIPAEPNSWTSLSRTYQLDEGWFQESPWSVPDASAALTQLTSIDPTLLKQDEKTVLTALCTLFQTAVELDSGITIIYD